MRIRYGDEMPTFLKIIRTGLIVLLVFFENTIYYWFDQMV